MAGSNRWNGAFSTAQTSLKALALTLTSAVFGLVSPAYISCNLASTSYFWEIAKISLANSLNDQVLKQMLYGRLRNLVLGGFLEETVLEKVEEIGKKLDDLRGFLEDVFLTVEESILLKETDEIVQRKRFAELKSLDEV